MEIKKVSQTAREHGIKALVYGLAGSGKTTLATTTPEPDKTLILSAESGLLSIRDSDVDTAQIKTIADMEEAYEFLQDSKYTWVIIDSLSEIAELVLVDEKAQSRDGRMAYGNLADRMIAICKMFRDIKGVNIIAIAKEQVEMDAVGETRFIPMFPGAKLAKELPYLFDMVLCLRVRGEGEEIQRRLQCQPDEQYPVKDRSGCLDMFELPDWTIINNKIKGD